MRRCHSIYFDWYRFTFDYYMAALANGAKRTTNDMLDIYIALIDKYDLKRATIGAWRIVLDDLVRRGFVQVKKSGETCEFSYGEHALRPEPSAWMLSEIDKVIAAGCLRGKTIFPPTSSVTIPEHNA